MPLFLFACSSNEYLDVTTDIKTLSGVANFSEFPYTIEVGDTKIIIESDSIDDSTNSVELRTGYNWLGPNYITGTMKKLFENKKLRLNYSQYFGFYLCDVYSFNKTITLPSGAITAKIELPTNLPFNNYSTQERGVNYNMSITSSGVIFSITYYTLAINIDMLGRYYGGKVIPFDGRTVQVPYYYMVETSSTNRGSSNNSRSSSRSGSSNHRSSSRSGSSNHRSSSSGRR